MSVIIDFFDFDVRLRTDHLLVRLHVAILLVLEVTEGTTQRESPIDTALSDETPRVHDTAELLGIVGLVID